MKLKFNNEGEEEKKKLHAQLATELGAESLQAWGRVRAFVTFKGIPNWALFLKASQRQFGAVLSIDFNPEQHVPCGFVVVLSFVTNDKQSTKFDAARLVQSTDEGDGACAWCDDEAALLR